MQDSSRALLLIFLALLFMGAHNAHAEYDLWISETNTNLPSYPYGWPSWNETTSYHSADAWILVNPSGGMSGRALCQTNPLGMVCEDSYETPAVHVSFYGKRKWLWHNTYTDCNYHAAPEDARLIVDMRGDAAAGISSNANNGIWSAGKTQYNAYAKILLSCSAGPSEEARFGFIGEHSEGATEVSLSIDTSKVGVSISKAVGGGDTYSTGTHSDFKVVTHTAQGADIDGLLVRIDQETRFCSAVVDGAMLVNSYGWTMAEDNTTMTSGGTATTTCECPTTHGHQ